MHLDLPPDQQAFLEGLVKAGRFPSTSKAIGEAVRLLASQEQLKQQVQLGVEEAERGAVTDHDTVFGQLRAMAADLENGRGT